MSKILVVLPGFGGNNIKEKIEIFCHNLKNISKNLKDHSIDFEIFNFDKTCYNLASFNFNENGNKYPNINIINENMIRGVVGEFLYKYITPSFVNQKNYEYVMILLDDVMLINTDFSKMMKIIDNYSYDILSPALTHESTCHTIMKDSKNMCEITNYTCFRHVNAVELFCYFMKKDVYNKYHSILDEKTSWLWGIDFSLHNLGFKCGIVDSFLVKHMYPRGMSNYSNLPDPEEEMEHNRKKYTFIGMGHHKTLEYNFIKNI